jgi:hypothetical protein
MNVIFLDIDETMNCISNTIRCRQLKIASHSFAGFNPVAVGLLRELVKLTDASIVLSSTWRLHYESEDDCIAEFIVMMAKYYGWEDFPIVGVTNALPGCRGDEIQQWIEMHYCTQYVIIDDSSDMLESQQYNFVRIDYRNGFAFDNFIECLEIFDITSKFSSMKLIR